MSMELSTVEANEKKKNKEMESLVTETKNISKRKEDLQDKLKDLESLRFVVDELELKENELLW